MMGDQLLSAPDSELFSKSDEDSAYTDINLQLMNISTQSTCDEIEDGLSFAWDHMNTKFWTNFE